jgi:hypothetical protein
MRGGVETEMMMSASEGPSSRRPHKPGIKENQNAKRCRNLIRARADEMAAKRETMMSAGEGPSGGGVNPMPETRVLNWILSDSDEGPSSGKEERANEGAAKWVRILSYGPPCAHYLGGYQDRLLGGPLGLPDLRCTAPDGVKHKDYGGEVLG